MEKQYVIPVVLGASILLAAVSTSLLPLQFASGTTSNMTGGPSANTTGALQPSFRSPPNSVGALPPSLRSPADSAGGPPPTRPSQANPAGGPPVR